jgi:Flp pilus assembly protein TadG
VSESLTVHAGRCRDERGASAVEFALVVPFLLLIVFGIIVYGMVFAQSLSLSNAARQAARSGVVEGTSSCDEITSMAHDAADTMGMDGDDASVSIAVGPDKNHTTTVCGGGGSTEPCEGTAAATNVYVTLTYDTDPVVPFVPVPSQLTGEGVYRCEFS